MKRALVFFVVSLLLFGLVSAGMTSRATENLGDNDSGNSNEKGNKEQTGTQNQGDNSGLQTQNQEENQEGEQLGNIAKERNRLRVQITEGECPEKCTCTGSATKCQLRNGTREMTIHAGNSGNIIIQTKGVNASTKVALYNSEDEKLYGVFRGNRTREVKMLPDQVQERIREKLQRQLENEGIELDEDGTYNYQARERARLFAIFPVRVRIVAEVNSETGEIVRIRKAWWAVFTNRERKEIVGTSCGTVTPGYNNQCCKDKGYDVWNEETAECGFNQ